MSSAPVTVSPIFTFFEKCAKLKSGKEHAAKFKMRKATREKLGALLSIYNVDLTKKFGVADIEPGKSHLGKKEVEAIEHISSAFMSIADFIMQLSKSEDGEDDFEALVAAGIPQLIHYQLSKGEMCHNKVAKSMSEMLGYIG